MRKQPSQAALDWLERNTVQGATAAANRRHDANKGNGIRRPQQSVRIYPNGVVTGNPRKTLG